MQKVSPVWQCRCEPKVGDTPFGWLEKENYWNSSRGFLLCLGMYPNEPQGTLSACQRLARGDFGASTVSFRVEAGICAGVGLKSTPPPVAKQEVLRAPPLPSPLFKYLDLIFISVSNQKVHAARWMSIYFAGEPRPTAESIRGILHMKVDEGRKFNPTLQAYMTLGSNYAYLYYTVNMA